MLYQQYADKKPVMLFDIQEQRIYALPYADYRAELSKRSQASLKKQYARAIADGEIVIFVRDNHKVEARVIQPTVGPTRVTPQHAASGGGSCRGDACPTNSSL